MSRHVIAAVIVLTPLGTAANSPMECKAEVPAARTGYWSWRNVDGKRCWYPGRPGMDKANLQWPRPTTAPAVDTVSDKALLELYWPNLEELLRWPQ